MKKILVKLSLILLFAVLFNSCEKDKYDLFCDFYGTITDSANGNTLGNANVVLSPGGKTKITGNDGLFEFHDLDIQQYTITVQKTGYQTNRKTISAIAGEKTEVNISLTQNDQ